MIDVILPAALAFTIIAAWVSTLFLAYQAGKVVARLEDLGDSVESLSETLDGLFQEVDSEGDGQ